MEGIKKMPKPDNNRIRLRKKLLVLFLLFPVLFVGVFVFPVFFFVDSHRLHLLFLLVPVILFEILVFPVFFFVDCNGMHLDSLHHH